MDELQKTAKVMGDKMAKAAVTTQLGKLENQLREYGASDLVHYVSRVKRSLESKLSKRIEDNRLLYEGDS